MAAYRNRHGDVDLEVAVTRADRHHAQRGVEFGAADYTVGQTSRAGINGTLTVTFDSSIGS